jgi:hypothetical protein
MKRVEVVFELDKGMMMFVVEVSLVVVLLKFDKQDVIVVVFVIADHLL